jgi:hypothetical protein
LKFNSIIAGSSKLPLLLAFIAQKTPDFLAVDKFLQEHFLTGFYLALG